MTKWLRCDAAGCSTEEQTAVGFDGKDIKRVAVAITWPAPAETECKAFELCEKCRGKFLKLADPKAWT